MTRRPGRFESGARAGAPPSRVNPRFLNLSVALVFLAGCETSAPPPPEVVRDTAERGPLRLTAEASPATAWFGDAVTVKLSMRTPLEYDVRFPDVADFGGLAVSMGPPQDARPAAEGGLEWRQTYSLVSFTSGALEIPPLAAKYRRKASSATTGDVSEEAGTEQELAVGTLRVEIRSALTSQDSMMSPRDVTGTAMPSLRLTAWQWVMIGGGVVAAAFAVWGVAHWIRSVRRRPAPPLLPEVWALRALSELAVGGWVESGRAREFYYRLSEIVRRYIELKFNLAAPEMTSEEFLTLLLRRKDALPYDAERLRRFMSACDLVKYAAYGPRKEDAEEALGTARAFVDATAAAAATDAARRSAEQAATVASRGVQGGKAA